MKPKRPSNVGAALVLPGARPIRRPSAPRTPVTYIWIYVGSSGLWVAGVIALLAMSVSLSGGGGRPRRAAGPGGLGVPRPLRPLTPLLNTL